MYLRKVNFSDNKSFFLFGPRGTGKSTWIRHQFPDAYLIDLLDEALFQEFLRDPGLFAGSIRSQSSSMILVDEIQRLPGLLNEVHRLMENDGYRFGLTGSSARKLRRQGTNLLAGRARTLAMHPMTATELGADFDLMKSLKFGHLPEALLSQDAGHYLKSYVGTYLREEIQQEAFVRNLKQFADFLEIAAFSQAAVLTVSNVAKDCGIDRKTANNYFDLLEDLLIAYRLPAFQRRAKRKLTAHPKFFYFDVGLYRALRKRGPLDPIEEIEGPAIETLVAQEVRATNDYFELGYDVSFWRSASQHEVDFVLYGERGFIAIEVKRSSTFRRSDLESLQLFQSDYPEAEAFLVYLGDKSYLLDNIRVEPLASFLKNLPEFIKGSG